MKEFQHDTPVNGRAVMAPNICYQCLDEICSYQHDVIRTNGGVVAHLHGGCVEDFEIGSPIGTTSLAEDRLFQELFAAAFLKQTAQS
jgi:hypothetical protein